MAMSEEENMSLVDHLTELRRRIVWVLILFVVTLVGGLLAAEPVISYLKSQPPLSQTEWNAFSPWDAIRIYMMFALMIAVAISLPFILYQLWSFMKPGLREVERRAAYRYIPITILLFLSGFSFAYFIVFPLAFHFTSAVTQRLNLIETYGITQYFSFMFNIVLPMSLLFQMPVIVMFLTEIRILNPHRLKKIRKPAYLLLVVIATMVTPPDLLSAILVAVPLILLYECSVLLSSWIYRTKCTPKQTGKPTTASDLTR